ncbi:DUF397 domain-containing protein [Streptomyces massasporeus]|uniref:DUF397 domain-containing protein n=1 Tax=Streptomyces massasporeus TaxID=67324 RepID=UPI00381997DF
MQQRLRGGRELSSAPRRLRTAVGSRSCGTASHSGQQGNRMEAPTAVGGRAVRDSELRDGPLLTVSGEGWQACVGQFE